MFGESDKSQPAVTDQQWKVLISLTKRQLRKALERPALRETFQLKSTYIRDFGFQTAQDLLLKLLIDFSDILFSYDKYGKNTCKQENSQDNNQYSSYRP